MIWTHHPSGLELSMYVDGDLPPARTRELDEHLRTCDACRGEVEFYRELSAVAAESAAALRDVPVPDVADEVLRRRRAGERIDLLVDVAADWYAADDEIAAAAEAARTGRSGSRVQFGLAASIALAVLATGYVLLVPPAGAHRSELRLAPSPPAAGDTIRVAYSPASYLAGHDSLRLRVRVRDEAGPLPRTGVIGELRTATLRPTGDGSYEGRVVLDPGDLYLAAAVEDFEAQDVDANFGRLWDAVVAGEEGEPGIAALESRYRVLEHESAFLATERAARIVERDPDNPFGRALQFLYESRVLGSPDAGARDSLIARHRASLRGLLERRRGAGSAASEADPAAVAWLATYARLVGEVRLHDSLVAVLAGLDPGHDVVVLDRILTAYQEHGADAPALLSAFERAWRETGGNRNLFALGLQQAAGIGDDAAVRRWLARRGAADGQHDGLTATLLDPHDQYAAARIELRRARLAELLEPDDADRPLRLNAAEFAAAVELEARRVRTALARDLALVGDTAEALALYREAADRAWRPETLEPYVDFLLATGDTAEALPAVGVLLADPLDGERLRETYAPLTRGADADALLARGRQEWTERVRSSLVYGRRMPADTDLAPASGEPFRAGALSGTPVVFASWAWVAPSSDDELREFAAAAARFGPRAIRFLALAHETPRPTTRDAAGDVPIIVDHGYAVRRALQTYSAVTYVVLDDRLTVAARTGELDDALRVAHALSRK